VETAGDRSSGANDLMEGDMAQQERTPALPGAQTSATPPARGRDDRRAVVRGALSALTVIVVVVGADQAVKWWAWRHASTVRINSGGNPLVPASLGGLYADPVAGALLDILDCGLVAGAVFLLLSRRRPLAVVLFAAVMLGGWTSNLLDRLGMHYWTAPGSLRGAVDFIHIGRFNYNIADAFIIAGTPLFVLAVAGSVLRAMLRGRQGRAASGAARPPPGGAARGLLLAGAAGLVAVVAIGATDDDGVVTPRPSTAVTAPPELQPAPAPDPGSTWRWTAAWASTVWSAQGDPAVTLIDPDDIRPSRGRGTPSQEP
jgi:lipoprotein signal peptidase